MKNRNGGILIDLLLALAILATLIAALTEFGNSAKDSQTSDSSVVKTSEVEVQETPISFSEFGKLIDLPSNASFQQGSFNGVAATCGDFDGDGDLDLACLTYGGKIIFVENKMPQKNSK